MVWVSRHISYPNTQLDWYVCLCCRSREGMSTLTSSHHIGLLINGIVAFLMPLFLGLESVLLSSADLEHQHLLPHRHDATDGESISSKTLQASKEEDPVHPIYVFPDFLKPYKLVLVVGIEISFVVLVCWGIVVGTE